MTNTNRRHMLRVGLAFLALPNTFLQDGFASHRNIISSRQSSRDDGSADITKQVNKGKSMKIQYLEVVTGEVDAICATYSQALDVSFGTADPSLGGARTAELDDGGMLGVRAPMHDAEKPVVRPYFLVEDLHATVETAAEAGAMVAVPPMELGDHGSCAIVIQGGIDTGFWQL